MPFGLFRRRHKQTPSDPLAAFDSLIDDLERQAALVRKAAATLLALRGELERTAAREERRRAELSARLRDAGARGEARLEEVLASDVAESERRLAVTRDAIARSEADAPLLLDAGRELARELVALRNERVGAAARLQVDAVVTAALRERVERFEHVLAVDAARDEVERAHALAEIYRGECGVGTE